MTRWPASVTTPRPTWSTRPCTPAPSPPRRTDPAGAGSNGEPAPSRSVQDDRGQLVPDVAGAGVLRRRRSAEVPNRAPDRVEGRGHRALGPAGGEGDVVAGEEDAALGLRQFVLHEVPE